VEETLVRAVCLHRGLDKPAARKTARDLLHEVGLPESLLASRPARLSGGQRQRVALARALAAEPDVLIADEITSALDPKSAEQVLDTLLALTRDRGLSVLLITHDHDLADELCGAVVDLSPAVRRP
jgi:peptide/nickel transport system ATP-binding protein